MWTHDVLDAVLAHAESTSPAVRLAVAQAIPSCVDEPPDPRAVEALARLTGDENDDARDWATFGLGTQIDIDTPAIRDVLAARLDDQHDDTRAEAIVGLARRRDERALKATYAALTSEWVGRLAVEASALLGNESLLATLLELRDWWDVDPELLEEAIRCCDPAGESLE